MSECPLMDKTKGSQDAYFWSKWVSRKKMQCVILKTYSSFLYEIVMAYLRL